MESDSKELKKDITRLEMTLDPAADAADPNAYPEGGHEEAVFESAIDMGTSAEEFQANGDLQPIEPGPEGELSMEEPAMEPLEDAAASADSALEAPMDLSAEEPAAEFAPDLSESAEPVLEKSTLTPPPSPSQPTQTRTKTISSSTPTSVPTSPPTETADLPFHLWITGELAAYEKERLLDIVRGADLGIRDADLEVQFESKKIFLPSLSEYLIVKIVQAIRATTATLKVSPATEGMMEPESAPRSLDSQQSPQNAKAIPGLSAEMSRDLSESAHHAAEQIPVSTNSILPEMPDFKVIDVLTVSTIVPTEMVEKDPKHEALGLSFTEVVDALQLELKYKGYRKGAEALISFEVETLALSLRGGYRVTAKATAIRRP